MLLADLQCWFTVKPEKKNTVLLYCRIATYLNPDLNDCAAQVAAHLHEKFAMLSCTRPSLIYLTHPLIQHKLMWVGGDY